MVSRTDQRGYVYPECDPPEVKDRSDIDYMRELAVQVNNDAAVMDARLLEVIEKQDAARILFNGNITTSGSVNGFFFQIPYDTVTYDNTTGSTDLTEGGIRVLQRGLYFFSSTLRCTNGGGQALLLRHLRNGNAETRRYDGPAGLITASEDNMTVADVIMCNAGDLVKTQARVDGVGGSFTFEARLTMFQFYQLDL